MSQPNILFLLTDDQRHDTIAALGNPLIHTPNMDRLVRSGTAFQNAHIPGGTSPAVCMPSRAMIHTGRPLFRIDGCGEKIDADKALMCETFRAAGYQTCGIGKWHNGRESYARSFDCGAEILFGGMADHWNVPVYDFDASGTYGGTVRRCVDAWHSNEVKLEQCDKISAGKHSTEIFADAALNFLEMRDDERPFFCCVAYMAPHDPRTMPEEFLKMYDPKDLQLPKNFLGAHPFDTGALKVRDEMLAGFPRSPNEVRRHLAEYYAMISHLDHHIGRILDKLECEGLWENTIIVLASDNGLALGSHGLMGKQSCYEHSVRVPLIFAGPRIKQAAISEASVYLYDVFPTLCELAGLDKPPSVEGLSLRKCLEGGRTEVREALYFAYTDKQRAVKKSGWKLIEYATDDGANTQLFHLTADPFEVRNLADNPSHDGVLKMLRAELLQKCEESAELSHPMGKAFWDKRTDLRGITLN